VISTLRVDDLRVDLTDQFLGGSATTKGGICPPNAWLNFADALCPTSGSPAGGSDVNSSYDDTSGGSTTLDVPQVVNTIPPASGSVSVPFRAYADLTGPAPKMVVLNIFHRLAGGGDGARGHAPVQIALKSGGRVGSLGKGRYNAHWTITDQHGDTRVVITQFAVQATPGASVAAPDHFTTVTVSCKRRVHKHDRSTAGRTACSVHHLRRDGSIHDVELRMTRHHRLYAIGHARPRHSVVHITMHAFRRLRAGKYTMRLLIWTGNVAVRVSRQVRIR
jgi:hypothetical protein